MIAVIAATSAPDGAERDTARLRYQPSHLGGRGRVPWRTTGTLTGAHISRPNATMHWSRSGGWEPGHDFHRGLLTRSSSSAWSPSQTGLGGRFFISAVRNVVSVSIEGRSSRPTCSSHTVGALSRRRKASRTTSRHIGISRQTSSSWPFTACPEMRSAEYGRALAANGGRQLAQAFDPHWDDEFRNSLPPPESCAVGGCIF